MINPEPTDLLVSVLCLYLAARILVAARATARRAAIGLGVALGAGEMVRQFSLWTLAVVVLAFGAALWARAGERRALAAHARGRARRVRRRRRPVVRLPRGELLERDLRPSARRQAAVGAAAGELLRRPGLPDVFSQPYRPHMANLAWPQTYTDMWGDWYGVFAWRRADAAPPPATNGWLVAQNVVGLVPTVLAVVGLARAARPLAAAPRRRRGCSSRCCRSPGIAGYLYFTVSYPVPDGDVLKPTYMLSTLGAWALCFAWAASRSPRARASPRSAVLAAAADLQAVPLAVQVTRSLLLLPATGDERLVRPRRRSRAPAPRRMVSIASAPGWKARFLADRRAGRVSGGHPGLLGHSSRTPAAQPRSWASSSVQRRRRSRTAGSASGRGRRLPGLHLHAARRRSDC